MYTNQQNTTTVPSPVQNLTYNTAGGAAQWQQQQADRRDQNNGVKKP